MKVYKIKYCEDYRSPTYSDDNLIDIYDISYLLINEKIEFDSNMSLKFDFCTGENRQRISCDFMRTNPLGIIWVASERAKEIIQSAYGDFIRFFPVEGTDEHSNKYYVFIPSGYVEFKDVIDVDRSWFYGRPPIRKFRQIDGIYDISDIIKFCFKENVKDHPVFWLKQSGHNKKTGKAVTRYENFDIFVIDEFVQLVKKNNLTGLNFVEIFDSETFELTEEATAFERNFIMIPTAHENGVFTPGELGMPYKPGRPFPGIPDEYLMVEYKDRMITNSSNSYTVYDIDNCDMANDIKATYSGGRLQSVYVFSDGLKLPVYICFEFSMLNMDSLLNMKKKLLNTAIECVKLCGKDLLEELKNAKTPLGSLSLEYYYDDEQMNINLQDSSCNIYPIGNAASHLLRCICNCAGERNSLGYNFGYKVFECILKGLHEKLSEDIPNRFEVTDDFELSEPKMYD